MGKGHGDLPPLGNHTLWFPEFFGNDPRMIPRCSRAWSSCGESIPTYLTYSPQWSLIPYHSIVLHYPTIPHDPQAKNIFRAWCPHPHTISGVDPHMIPGYDCWFWLAELRAKSYGIIPHDIANPEIIWGSMISRNDVLGITWESFHIINDSENMFVLLLLYIIMY